MISNICRYLIGIVDPLEKYGLRKKLYWWSRRELGIRYIPIRKEIRENIDRDARVLEVGSGYAGGLYKHTKRKNIFYLDKYIEKPNYYSHKKFINANALNLPFKNDSFDLVCSIDMLEHIPQTLRRCIVFEMCRVSRKKVIIGVPCGEKSEYFENKVRNKYFNILQQSIWNRKKRDVFIQSNIFILEHQKYGLPEEEEIKSLLDEYGKIQKVQFDIKIRGNESLYVWYYGVLGDMKYNCLRWGITTLIFIIFFHLLVKLRIGGYYRKFFIFELKK